MDQPSRGSKKQRPVNTKKGLSRVDGHEGKAREEFSTPDLETSVIVEQHKTEETESDGEGTKVVANKGT